jgi:predicted MFS family arabinose efflux permease
MLLVLYTLYAVDRFVIAVVIEPIRHEFHLSDTELGAIGGLAHAIAYSVCVLPVGWLLDRRNRVRLLAAMLAIWSILTTLGALASGFWFLFLMRMGVGAAESASSTATQSLIASIFPLKQRATAMGIVYSGAAIGTGLIFAIGGPIAHHFGWRIVFLIAGVPGLLLALLMWFRLQEPPRSCDGSPVAPPLPMWQVAKVFFRHKTLLLTTIGSTLAGMNIATIWVWISPILMRQHQFSLSQAGLIVGISAGVLKCASGILSGFATDWIAKGRIDRMWIVPATALTLSLPVSIAIAMTSSQWLAGALVLVLGLTLGTHYAAPKSVLMTVAPENMRGSVAAIEQLMVNMLGVSMGPLLTGMISDYLGGANSVGVALAATVSLNVVAALCFWLAMRDVKPALAPGRPPAAPHRLDEEKANA